MTRRANEIDPAETGRLIRRLRHEHDLTQADLAAHLGVRPTAVMRWEKGTHAPSEAHAHELAGRFGLPVEAFFTTPAEAAAAREQRLDQFEQALATLAEAVARIERRLEEEAVQ